MLSLSASEARGLAVAAQGLAKARSTSKVGRREVRAAVEKLGALQLDAINVVERTQFLVLFSRLGAYDQDLLHGLTGPQGALLEFWGHAASLLPMARQPYFRWRMQPDGGLFGGPTHAAGVAAWEATHGEYLAAILEEIRERGPLTAGELRDPRPRDGEWWGRRSVGRQALERLFAQGQVAGWRNRSFERVYDLPERVIPKAVLDATTPSVDDAHRELVAWAAGALGVATARDLASYYMLKTQVAKARALELVEEGRLELVSVEGWPEPAFSVRGARPPSPDRLDATLLSPFDSLIWERERTRRVFGFDYRIEVYIPAPARVHGYYVLPLLLGDRLVARFDLKADRKASTLRVLGAYLEPHVKDARDRTNVAHAAAGELSRLARWMNLGPVEVAGRGDFAPAVRKAVSPAARRRRLGESGSANRGSR